MYHSLCCRASPPRTSEESSKTAGASGESANNVLPSNKEDQENTEDMSLVCEQPFQEDVHRVAVDFCDHSIDPQEESEISYEDEVSGTDHPDNGENTRMRLLLVLAY